MAWICSTGNTPRLALGPDQVREAAARYLHPGCRIRGGVPAAGTGRGSDRRSSGAGLRGDRSGPGRGLVTARQSIPPVQPVPGASAGERPRWYIPGSRGSTSWCGASRECRSSALGLYVPKPETRSHRTGPGLGALTIRSAIRGAGAYDAGALAFAFEGLGGSIAAGSASDWLGFGASVLAERLSDAAVLLDLVFREPHLAEADVHAERSLMVAEAERVPDDMFRYPFQLAFSAAYGERGYGLPVGGLPNTLAAIEPAEVRRWHGRALVPIRPVVIAVGDVDPERASDQLAAVFGRYPARAGARARAHGVGGRPDGAAGDAAGDTRQGTGRARHGVPRPEPARSGLRGRAGLGRGGERARRASLRGPAGPSLAGVHRRGDRMAEGPGWCPAELHRDLARAGRRGSGRDAARSWSGSSWSRYRRRSWRRR